MKTILTIWKKELKDNIRDRRTLMAMILMPLVLMPALLIGMDKLVNYQRERSKERTARVAVDKDASASALIDFLKSQKKIEVIGVEGGPEKGIRDGKADIGIIVPADFQDRIKSGAPARITLVQDSTKMESQESLAKVNLAVSAFSGRIIEGRLNSSGVDNRLLTPITMATKDISTAEERGGFGLGFFLPFFVIIWAIVGGQYIAIDVSAGEKERKTLEALLLTPAKRLEIVLGKFFAVSTTAVVSVVVSLTSLYVALKVFGLGPMTGALESGQAQGKALAAAGADAAFSIEPLAILVMLGVGLLLVLMFSAILLSIAIFAKSFKEAQNYIGPAYLVAIMPAVVMNAMFGFKPTDWFYAIPIVNAMLLFKEALMGSYVVSHILITAVTLIVFAIIAILVAGRIYSQEKVLFR
ncbi:MAG: ABC transporter permease [Actinobacteria bacterium]|nr:ABC transporter permease [Actinomycetota bacterium]